MADGDVFCTPPYNERSLGFLMNRLLFLPLAVLLQLKPILQCFFILARKVVHAMAGGTLKFNKVILGHDCKLLINDFWSRRPDSNG